MAKALNLNKRDYIANQPKGLMSQCKSNLNRKQIHTTVIVSTVSLCV